MPKLIHFILLGILSVPVSAWAEILTQSDLTGLPQRTKKTLMRYEACLHFAGEWSGEPSRDRYVRQRIRALNCVQVERDIDALRRQSAAHSQTRRLIEKIEYEYGQCQNKMTSPLKG